MNIPVKYIVVLLSLTMLGNTLRAQYVYTINADSVKITNHCDTAELILENHTQNVPGFLFNKGRGRTEFRRALQRLDSNRYLIGGDTLYTPSYAWIQGGNTFGATGILGTLDNNHLDFYTNQTRQLRLTNTGNLLLGTTTDNGAKLQVNGAGTFHNIVTSPGADSGTGLNHIALSSGGALDIIGTYGHDMTFQTPNEATNFRFEFGSYPYVGTNGTDFTINGNNGGNVILASSNHYFDFGNLQNVYTDASYINLIDNNSNGGDGVVIQRGPRSTVKTDPILSLRDSITDMFKVLRNGAQFITGNVTAATPVHTNYTPVVTQTSDAPTFGSITGIRVAPTLNVNGVYAQAYAMDISPTYNLNGLAQHEDDISPALHVNSNLGGVRIDQIYSYPGNTGQPLFIYQGGGTDKSAIRNYRNGAPSVQAFVWNNDNRPSSILGAIVPALRSTVSENVVAGGGVSLQLDRFYYGIDASLEMKYELSPQHDTASTLKTAFAFNTVDLGYRSAALYISGSKIGIGTTTPAAQLHTTGSVRFAGLTSDTSQTRVLVSDASGNLSYRTLSSWATNGVFNSDLAVNGTLRTQQLKLTPHSWADYVFDKNYRLPSLAEVENYIKQYNHLPGIPSAGDVAQNGIDVGASQADLLKKIEELTLYVIDQQKKLQKQSDEINVLKEQNKALDTLKQEMAELKKLVTNH